MHPSVGPIVQRVLLILLLNLAISACASSQARSSDGRRLNRSKAMWTEQLDPPHRFDEPALPSVSAGLIVASMAATGSEHQPIPIERTSLHTPPQSRRGLGSEAGRLAAITRRTAAAKIRTKAAIVGFAALNGRPVRSSASKLDPAIAGGAGPIGHGR